AAHPRPAAPAPVAPLAAAFVVGVVAAGGALGAVAWRRGRPEPVTPEDPQAWCLAWAAFFDEAGDAEAALECLAAARAHADEEDHELLLWEASCLDHLGRLEDALAKYEAAVAVAPRGECEAAFGAAILAGQLGREQEALLHLRLCLMADPFLHEVLDELSGTKEDPFAPLRPRPGYRQLLRDARGWARAAGGRAE
ncbi:MAG TPA: hypothetical protein VNX21_08640, partial [Candidatus Thermoplasmatota archaeon]|nr:hypothetical protein [Candidatus Thermoplasmatota archaeon]